MHDEDIQVKEGPLSKKKILDNWAARTPTGLTLSILVFFFKEEDEEEEDEGSSQK